MSRDKISECRILGILLVGLTCISAASGVDAAEPVPMPDKQDLTDARKQVRELFVTEFKAKKAADRRTFAQHLLQLGKESEADRPTHCTLLDEPASKSAATCRRRVGYSDLGIYQSRRTKGESPPRKR